jgi:putative transposase
MNDRDHLRRLPREYYSGEAVVHWTMTILERRVGWLSGLFLYRFRELLTHTMFRYGLVCPIYCVMPDHIHLIWMGLFEHSDQINAMKHFRPRCDSSLQRIGFGLQDQAYDHLVRVTAKQSNNVARGRAAHPGMNAEPPHQP